MKFAYPVEMKRDGDVFVAIFPDVPEAVTQAGSRDEALAAAGDALVAALGGYVAMGRRIPKPSLLRGRPAVGVPPLAAAKLALYDAMREAGVNNVQMGRRLGVSEGAVRRLLDLDHRSHISGVEAALAQLGRRLVIDVAAAA